MFGENFVDAPAIFSFFGLQASDSALSGLTVCFIILKFVSEASNDLKTDFHGQSMCRPMFLFLNKGEAAQTLRVYLDP